MSSDTPVETEGSDTTAAADSCLIFLILEDIPDDRFCLFSKLDENKDDFGIFECFLDVRGVPTESISEFDESVVSSRIFRGFLLLRKFLAHIDKSLWIRR